MVNVAQAGMSDERLAQLLLEVPSRSAVLFEDVDAVLDGRRISTGGSTTVGTTFSGLLNVLDGAAARPGVTIWLTTNHRERLDPALIRPGRVDREIQFGHATADQIERLFLNFYGRTDTTVALARGWAARKAAQQVTMAEVQQHLLLHKNDPAGAARLVPRPYPVQSAGEPSRQELAAV